MSCMAAQDKSINLLPQEEFEASIPGRILRWAMGTFRIIVIITEMVVMAAFLSRFWLDAQNSDLNDSIAIKSAQVSAQSDFEKNFRTLQDRLTSFSDYEKSGKDSNILTKVVSTIPGNVVLQSLSFQNGSTQIKGIAGSEIDIAQFLSNLKAEPSFKNVTLGQVGTFEGSQTSSVFDIKVNY